MNIGILGPNNNTGLGIVIQWLKRHLPINSHFVTKLDNHINLSEDDNMFISIPQYTEAELREYLRLYDPDIILFVETPYNFKFFEIVHPRKIYPIPIIDATKTGIWKEYNKYITKYLCPIHVCFRSYMQYYGDKAVYLPYPIDTDYFRPQKRSDDYFFLHNQGNGGAHFRKGTDLIHRAFAFNYFKCKGLLQYQSDLHKMYKLPPTSNLYTYEVNYNDQIDLYKEGQVYLNPERKSGLGLPLLESMACGYALIATDIAPFNEFVADKRFLIDYSQPTKLPTSEMDRVEPDIESLVEAMEFCENNPEIVKEQGELNRQIIETKYSWKVLKEQYMEYLS